MSCESILSDSAALRNKAMCRKLEITAISTEDLVEGGKRVKKNVFVAFDIAGNDSKWPMSTSLGGSDPTWQEKLETEFMLSETEPGFMYVRVYCRTSGKDKHVGMARVPVKDFTGEYAPFGFLHCLSYRLWDGYGKRNGIVNFSARIVPDYKGGVPPFWLR